MLPQWHMRSRAAFSFLGKNPAVFASENPRILFMANRQKLQECVSHLPLLRTSDFSVEVKECYKVFISIRLYMNPESVRESTEWEIRKDNIIPLALCISHGSDFPYSLLSIIYMI